MLPLALLKAEPLVVIIKEGCIGVTGIKLLGTTFHANEELKGPEISILVWVGDNYSTIILIKAR